MSHIEGKQRMLEDVTECLKATDRLAVMGRLVAEAKYVMVFVATRNGRIKACNALAGETFGYTENEILSQHMNTLFGSAKDEVWKRISESVSQDMQWRGELVGICKDGRKFPVDMAVSRSRSQGKAEAGIICFVRDVRKEKKIDQMKSEYISMASHEMRTPLTSIKNAVDMVLRKKAGSITEIQEKFMLMAQRNINRLGTLIDNMLDVSRIEAGRMELDYVEMDIHDSIKHVVNTLRALAEKKAISLEVRVSPNLPVIFADVTRIEEVMINLIGNAVKFTPENGTITLEAYPIEEIPEKLPGDARGFVKVSVTDTGIGIPDDLVEHIFEKFYQVSPTLAGEKEAGTGLGLSISKKIILVHGGDLTCKTKEHEGSTFSFTLPIIDMERRLYSCLEDRITKALEMDAPITILFLRIEGFSDLLESYGRKECARGLEMVKKRILEMGIKTSDEIFTAPWNGEIIMSMPGTDRHGAGVVRKKIREYISDKGISIGSPPTGLSLVSGIASFPEQGTSPVELDGLGRKRLKDL